MRKATLMKYARENTPRYTSYPTAPHFHDGVDGSVFARWLGEISPDTQGSLYLHVPYCREMCWYCGCSTRATKKDGPVAAYTKRLIQEIHHTADLMAGRPKIAHIHFGGGTPTILDDDQLTAVMDTLHARFAIEADGEIAIEIDPRIFTEDKSELLKQLGFNRASLGVQTFDDAVQAKINRVQPEPVVRACVDQLRRAGIADLSFDLLYGLPGQTTQTCLEDVHTAMALRPNRLSVFGYAHVPHMRKHQNLIKTEDLPGTDARIEQAQIIGEAITKAGYHPIGIDHYARPDDDMAQMVAAGTMRRNFQGYTTDQAGYLIGLGASAISKLPQGYAQNTADVAHWSKTIDAGQLGVVRGFGLDEEDRLRADIIERVMCDLRVDLDEVETAYGTSIPHPDLSDLITAGIVRQSGARIEVDEAYRMLARVVACRFDARFGAKPAKHSLSV